MNWTHRKLFLTMLGENARNAGGAIDLCSKNIEG